MEKMMNKRGSNSAAFVTHCFLGNKELTSGNCERPITSMAECEEAATQLGLIFTRSYETNTEQIPYCYFKKTGEELFFNSNSISTTKCTEERTCICK